MNSTQHEDQPVPARHDPYGPLRFRDFRLLIVGRFASSFGSEMLTFAIGWELWLRTHDALVLGLVGLVQVAPVVLLSLPAGHVGDQYNRKHIIYAAQSLLAACTLGLAWLSYTRGPLPLIYACLFGIGVSRAFNVPASSTLIPQTVPAPLFTGAATWSSSAWQLAAIAGPTAAGAVVAVWGSVTGIYLFDALAALVFLTMVALMRGRPLPLGKRVGAWESLRDGVRFIRNTKEILAAITLDMFAVLLGGSVMLLPIFATDVLKVGPQGLGLMRAMPSLGAVLMAVVLAHRPPFRHAGRTLILAVVGFGLATVVFGLSRSFWLSVAMLFSLGALDDVSVVIRNTLILVRTPDELRGRTSSVNNIFIGLSNELGAFESGLTASWFGPVVSVVIGGVGTVLVVLAVAKIWPELSGMTTLEPRE